MDAFDKYNNLTLGDILPIDGHVLYDSNPDYDTYLIRDGGLFKITKFHKTAASVMAANAEEARNFSRTGRMGASVKVASMPTEYFFELQSKGITQDKTEYAKWLNKSDNAGFRTNNLRV